MTYSLQDALTDSLQDALTYSLQDALTDNLQCALTDSLQDAQTDNVDKALIETYIIPKHVFYKCPERWLTEKLDTYFAECPDIYIIKNALMNSLNNAKKHIFS